MGEPGRLVAMGERLRAYRERLGKTQPELGEALSGVVWELHRKHVAISGDRVSKWERGECRPTRLYREAYRVCFNASDEDLGFCGTVTGPVVPATVGTLISPSPPYDLLLLDCFETAPRPVDEGYVASVRNTASMLVALDNLFGGDDLSALAVRAFRSAHRRLGAGLYERDELERELHAATGELAEVAAWMLYDADNQAVARQLNQEALLLARLSGDRAMELLVLQNMSMQAAYLGRPREALRLVTTVLESALSPRVEALFTIREARARAQLGEWIDAPRVFDRARSLFQDGVADTDPAWAWWVTGRELAWHEAMYHADLGDWARAVELFQQAAESCPVSLNRTRYNDLGHLFQALVEVRAWRDAETVITQALPYVGEVGSRRTAVLLIASGNRVAAAPRVPASVCDAAVRLLEVLSAAGYQTWRQ